ncbi:DNA polymerase II large subunit [uncultured archaeon]|nr:DNA polymerase II large subunit [uncultured archaeon]
MKNLEPSETDAATKEYLSSLKSELDRAYGIAEEARMKKFDPSLDVEIKPAADVAARVEGIVGPPGISKIIREIEKEGHSRETIAWQIVKKIVHAEVPLPPEIAEGGKQKLIEQAVRTGVGILTEGVLVAPTEGISKFEIRRNPDGSDYLAVYFAGPIRSAGGTVAALAVVLSDVARRELAVGDFRPTDTLIERYVEEIGVYGTRSAHLQYKPPDDDIRHIVRSCPICIDGDPTEDDEVNVHRDLKEVPSNRVRSGIALVICEGIAQKSAKVNKYTKKIKLDWTWMEPLIKVARKEGTFSPKPDFRFLDESVAGRAIFSYPSAKGGWRLRYGRTRAGGIMGKSVHPASMYILDSFLAIGTQMKIERPGKSTVVTPCDSILGPIVKLTDGSVVEVTTADEAKRLMGDSAIKIEGEKPQNQVERILFLGDMLVAVGDFIKSNHPLMPAAWCEERYEQEAKKAGVGAGAIQVSGAGVQLGAGKFNHNLSAGEAVSLSRRHNLPLHPRYTYFWHDITQGELRELALWLKTGKPNYSLLRMEEFELESAPAKSVLEELCVPHTVSGGKIKIQGEHAYALLKTLGIMVDKKITAEKFDSLFDEKKPILEFLSSVSGMKIMAKAPTYIGSRMGRPEKARERHMKKNVNVLFPVGTYVDKNASITRVYSKMKARSDKEGRGIDVEIARMRCKACGNITFSTGCVCGGYAVPQRICNKCGRTQRSEICDSCGMKTSLWEKRPVDIIKLFERAAERCGFAPDSSGNGSGGSRSGAAAAVLDVKGVEGLFSATKIPEPIEKGMLRAAHKVFVFRDGTCRFDATDIPLTHFKPREISTSLEQLRKMGYTTDTLGKPLTSPDQVVPLKVQDILLSRNGAEYLFKVAGFIDDLMVKLYGMKPFYNFKKQEDIVGQLVIGLSPHTSAGVLVRVIGFTDAHVGFGHPYFHTAKRRNADGDEDTVILLMDGLLNFSRFFLPESRGGTMDAPLVLTTEINPKEVDDESHAMETVTEYPYALYELSDRFAAPSELEIDTVKKMLGTPAQYGSLGYTHETTDISAGPFESTYLKFEDMAEKIKAQFSLQERVRAVDAADAAERLLLHHFLPDLYGNLRSFSQQNFRCLDCKIKYRRIPLSGKCNRCGGKLLLTVAKGGITKYLQHSLDAIERYHLPAYMKQRVELLKKDISSVFTEEVEKQKGLADFM